MFRELTWTVMWSYNNFSYLSTDDWLKGNNKPALFKMIFYVTNDNFYLYNFSLSMDSDIHLTQLVQTLNPF